MGNTELQRFINNKSLVALRKYAKLELQFNEAKKKAEAVTEQIKQAMIDNDVQKISGDWGSITLSERTTYKAEDLSEIPDNFTKRVLDNDKVKAEAVLTGELPAGVTVTKTKYIIKRLKEV